jgi:hypothetical protein
MYLTSKSYMGVMHPEPYSPPPFPLKVATALQVGGHTGWMDWLGADVNGIEKKKKKSEVERVEASDILRRWLRGLDRRIKVRS